MRAQTKRAKHTAEKEEEEEEKRNNSQAKNRNVIDSTAHHKLKYEVYT